MRSPLFQHFRALLGGGLALLAPVAAPAQVDGSVFAVSHYGGPLGGAGNADGPVPINRFSAPLAVTLDRAGNVYVADAGNNHSIRKVAPNGTVTTLVAPDGHPWYFAMPAGIAADSGGNVYVADSNQDTIYRITPAGVMTPFAGAPYQHLVYGTTEIGQSVDAVGTAARFFRPTGLVADSSDNIYVADTSNDTIRKITPGASVTTVAGSPAQAGSADGTGSAARFSRPTSVAVDGAGNIFVADAMCTIRQITPGGVVTTLAGTYLQRGSTDGTGAAARFSNPGVGADSAGNVYVADSDNSTIRLVTPGGVVSTFAGAVGQQDGTDGVGSAARFATPKALTVDSAGNLYVADIGNYTIRKITPGASVTTLAGLFGMHGYADGNGVHARFYYPAGVALDAAGNLYVADFYNNCIRKISPGSNVTTLAGAPDIFPAYGSDGVGTAAHFYNPGGVAVDASGNVFVADTGDNSIRKITPDGTVTTLAGRSASSPFGNNDGPAATATFAYPEGIAVDRSGYVYVADSANNLIRKIAPDGTTTTLAGAANTSGSADGLGRAARFDSPVAVAVDGAGYVFVADWRNHTIRQITSAGEVTTLAGTAGASGSADGTGAAARFNHPSGITVDTQGNVFVADSDNLTLRRITSAGVVTTLAGTPGLVGSADGSGPDAQFYYPVGIVVDGSDTLYIADQYNHAIRRAIPYGPARITTQPVSQTVIIGGTAQFSVTAIGSPAPTYQWYFNHSSLHVPGSTSSTLPIPNAQPANAGEYSVIVGNALGGETSQTVTLTVTTAPVGPPPAASGGGSGGGAIGGWFILGLMVLGAARMATGRRSKYHAIPLLSE